MSGVGPILLEHRRGVSGERLYQRNGDLVFSHVITTPGVTRGARRGTCETSRERVLETVSREGIERPQCRVTRGYRLVASDHESTRGMARRQHRRDYLQEDPAVRSTVWVADFSL